MRTSAALVLLSRALQAAFLAAVFAPAGRAAPPPPAGLDAAEEQRIADLISKAGVPSVSIAIVDRGRLVYAKALGMAALGPDRPADTSTRYFVGSISKQFTAAAVLLAAEDGKLSLDDRVARYYPELTRAADISVRQLLSHTSGYEDFAPQDYLVPEWARATSPETVLHAWAGKPLDFEPGTRWQYSNTNYLLAALIFQKATGEGLVPYLKRRIFDPLGMTSAGDGYLDRHPTDAVPYTRYGLGPSRPATPEANGWYLGAAQLAMTPSDLARWDMALLRRQVLGAKSYRDLTTEVRLANGDRTGYALGLSVGELDRIPQFSHSGEVSGFLTSNAIFPTRDAAVAVCSNEDSVFVVGPIEKELARWLLEPDRRTIQEAPPAETKQVALIVEGLRSGTLDRSLFTANANSYFSAAAIADIRESLKPFGAVKSTARTVDGLRGGMRYRFYKVVFESGSVGISVYVTPDGRYEQFMVEQDL